MYTDELKQIRQHVGTGLKRSGDKSNYVTFVEEEAAKEEAKIAAIVSEANETARKINREERLIAVREERRRLQREETPEIYQITPRMDHGQRSGSPDWLRRNEPYVA